MFVGQEVVLDLDFTVARARFAGLLRDAWLTGASGRAYAEGLAALIRVGPFGAVLGASKLVRVRKLEPVPHDDSVVLPVRWEATGVMGRLFPVLDADIILTPAGVGGTRLVMMGSYRPPLASVGSGLDRLVLHRAATLTIKSLVRRIAESLAEPAAAADGAERAVPGRNGHPIPITDAELKTPRPDPSASCLGPRDGHQA